MPRLGFPNHEEKASQYLVSRLFTDAVFNQDIRAIQLIINRIDGGLPKDCEIDDYQTLFGDGIKQVLNLSDTERLKVVPTDTVMMALCKSLYDLAVQDIYSQCKGKPSTDKKNERDTALRMVMERAGGRRTTPRVQELPEDVESATWLTAALKESEDSMESDTPEKV